ncbi:MAG TPA: DUF2937 family protein [Usitatibacter sp.]|nr:DUF2937 family protein [Usitatibacter sp.]
MILRGLFDRIVLVLAIFAAACIPSYVQQYRQRVGGHLDQVVKDLAPFREIAAKFHNGDIHRLIRQHLASNEPTFKAEGDAIHKMVDSEARLRAASEALNADVWHQLRYLLANADPAIAQATWNAYVPAFSFATEYVLFALGVGVSIWLLFLVAWIVTGRVISLGRRGSSRAPRAVRSSAGSTPSRAAPPRH